MTSSVRLCFVRFGGKDGALPPDEHSLNNLTKQRERGVSVYEAIERDGKYQILLPCLDPQAAATLGTCFNVAQGLWGKVNHPLYEVSGDVVGVGSDGEPLLRNCQVVQKITI